MSHELIVPEGYGLHFITSAADLETVFRGNPLPCANALVTDFGGLIPRQDYRKPNRAERRAAARGSGRTQK